MSTATENSRRWYTVVVLVLAAVALVAVIAVTVAVLSDDGPGNQPSAAPSSTSASTVPPVSASPIPSQPAVASFEYQPLWPFANLTEVEEWQRGYRSGGHSPWHLDAEATALTFTTGYLGFTGINVVVSQSINGNEALVTVGYPIENGKPGTAAVLHLARFGSGVDAPWEVVGSKDTTLTLTKPGYGATVGSPVAVGGRITGVDESIRVQVRQPSSEVPIGESCCPPAGGQDTPWSATVSFSGATAPALTIVASTGGHYTDVERFAITGVRPAA
jgi:hypothetical protein